MMGMEFGRDPRMLGHFPFESQETVFGTRTPLFLTIIFSQKGYFIFVH